MIVRSTLAIKGFHVKLYGLIWFSLMLVDTRDVQESRSGLVVELIVERTLNLQSRLISVKSKVVFSLVDDA